MNSLRLILPDTENPDQARAVWEDACHAVGFSLEIHSASDETARELARKLGLNTYPALLQADRIIAVGTPDAATARTILERLSRDDDP